MNKIRAFVTALGLVILAGGLSAQTELKDVAEVRDGIIHVGMAYEISQECDGIRARTFRGIGYLQSLKNRARELGYSAEDIDAYVNDRAEKRRLEQIARDRLAALGAVAGDAETYCAVGRAQIDADTRVGWLLR
ncbi:DUF5333 domain-containing protein [Yoonia sp.]|uniref:DUF5333 domain-containing protein n=1 Tax=Yoonia sp. TaxID=2212373 RepID=UPI0019FF214A|nr:DUF5333 domain-containing protein [Yoonia sp.]MBE0413191.1 DUF5333 domain-containing protein [Yoonia sp.]